MLNAPDHGWENNFAKVGGGTLNPWVGDSGGGGVGGTYIVPNPNQTTTVTKPAQQSYLCEDGEVVINGQRYIWNPEVDGWVVVLDLPSKPGQ